MMPSCIILCGNDKLRIDMDNVSIVKVVTSPKSKVNDVKRYCVAQPNMVMSVYIHFQNVGFK